MFHKISFIFLLLTFTLEFSVAQDTTIIKKHLHYLGSNLFEGRGTGSIGGELSAKYIALNLSKYKLAPMGYENTYYQYIPMHGNKPTDESKIIIVGKGNDTLNINKDFQFYHVSGRIFTPNPISVVFVGYGITAPEYNYDDYKNIKVESKVVVFLEGDPYSSNSKYFEGELVSNYSYADTKQKIALSKGASGTIQIPNYTFRNKNNWEKLIQEYYFEDISLAYLPTPVLSILLNPNSADKLFQNSEFSFVDIKRMYRKNKAKSFELKNKLLLKPKFIRRDFVSPNVVAYIKGSDKNQQDEYIVVSAHYDHLGIGVPVNGDSIYNGVLDNAIGVSALLELARLFGENNLSLKRSIIFLFVTGEEKGLLGSTYFIEHPPVSKEKIIANINIDGLAMFGNFKSVIGIGAELSTLNEALKIVADKNNLLVEKNPEQFNSYESFLRSDQLAFALAGVPSILISDGLIYDDYNKNTVVGKWKDYIRERYHTPFDDLTQKINYKASSKHIKVLYSFIKEIADSNFTVEWNDFSPFKRVKK